MCFVHANKNIPAMKTKTTTKITLFAGIVLFVMALTASFTQAQVFANAIAYTETEDLLALPMTNQPTSAIAGDETLLLDDWMYEEKFWQLPPAQIVPIEQWMFDANFWKSTNLFEWMTIPEEAPLKIESWMYTINLEPGSVIAFHATLQSWVKKREFQLL